MCKELLELFLYHWPVGRVNELMGWQHLDFGEIIATDLFCRQALVKWDRVDRKQNDRGGAIVNQCSEILFACGEASPGLPSFPLPRDHDGCHDQQWPGKRDHSEPKVVNGHCHKHDRDDQEDDQSSSVGRK